MFTVKINTTDVAWIRSRGIPQSEVVASGTDVNGGMYFQVQIQVDSVEHVTFAGARMIRFDIGADAPRDHNRYAMYPESYLVSES